MKETFIIVTWPEIQDYMDKPGFEENSCLINEEPFLIVCVTSLLHCIMLIAYKPVMDYMTNRRLEKLNKLKKLNKQSSNP